MYIHNQVPESKIFAGSRVTFLLSGRDTGGRFCMLRFLGPPGRSTPLHMHDGEDESIHVLEGSLEVTVDGKIVVLAEGQTILLPRKVPHRLATKGDTNARYIVVCAPAGFDGFVDACATEDDGNAVISSSTPHDVARLVAQAPRFGITLFPPSTH